MVKKTRVNLSNGLPLVVIEIPHSNSLAISFWTKSGARMDPEGKAGLAHFIEHLLIKKTKKYPTDIKLANVLEKVGAFKNGTTNKDWLNLNISSSNKDLDHVVGVLSEMVFNPYIEEKGFEAERKVILQEMAMKRSTPDQLVWEVWFKAFYGPGKMRFPVLGTEKSINNINVSDAISFWKTNFGNDSNLLIISGGITLNEAVKVAERYFGNKKLNPSQKVPTYNYNDSEKIRLEKLIIPRANMIMSFRIPGGKRYDDIYPLLLLRGVFTLGWSSRLYQRLRVKESLVYGVASKVVRYFDTGAFSLHLASDKKNFPRMISVLCEEIINIRENGVTKEELDLAKGYISGSVLSGVETSWDYSDWYALDELYSPSDSESPEERVRKINEVTKEEVERVTRKYFTPDNWQLAVVGDLNIEDIKVEL